MDDDEDTGEDYGSPGTSPGKMSETVPARMPDETLPASIPRLI
jgi:hypothetical protein